MIRMFKCPKKSGMTTNYLMCRRSRQEMAGRPREMNAVDLEFLRVLNDIKKSRRLRKTTALFCAQVKDVSMATIYRRMVESVEEGGLGMSRKKMTRINRNADPAKQVQFQRDVGHIHASRLVSVDGMIQAKNDFRDSFGWSEKGRDCVYDQIVVHDKAYPIMCAVSECGVLTFQRYHHTYKVTGLAVEAFLRDKVQPLLVATESVCILDNASNQSTDGVHAALDEVFGADYWYHIPAYSPRLAPIERVFALVKMYIRNREAEGEFDPEGLIDEAFDYYSYDGDGGRSVKVFFDGYHTNHRRWLAEQAANMVF